MKEIEILIEVKSSKKAALKALESFSAGGTKRTLDVYFQDPLRKDLQIDENNRLYQSFRLRQKDDKNSITYKIDHFDKDMWSYSDEFETEIDNAENTFKIIKKLGFEELIRIESEKHTYTNSEYEIVLEDVKNLGLFIEVEKLTETQDEKVEEVKEEIRSFLKTLNIKFGEEQNAGKPELMLRKNKKLL